MRKLPQTPWKTDVAAIIPLAASFMPDVRRLAEKVGRGMPERPMAALLQCTSLLKKLRRDLRPDNANLSSAGQRDHASEASTNMGLAELRLQQGAASSVL